MTGPGAAATTRTSTPKSFNFFSISREVISSVSDATLSCRSKAVSSKLTCGSLEFEADAVAATPGCTDAREAWGRIFTLRSALLNAAGGGLMMIGTGWCSSISIRSSIRVSSRSLAAFLPTAKSTASSRFSRKEVMKLSIRVPSAKATRAQEKLKTLATAITPKAIKIKPEPAKPSHLTLKFPRK